MELALLTIFVTHWAEFAVRWLHVITAIAWIGSSFYFIALDLGLRKSGNLPAGTAGEEWQVHGGGFYHIQKYLVAPAHLPEHLTWFKWESYATWLSGFALLVIVYYGGADLYLIDAEKAELSTLLAILISIGSLAAVWVIYSLLCRSSLGQNATLLMLVLYILLVALSWGYHQLFTGRAAFIHLGAVTATIMSANVFMVIIPNQKIVVADLKAGRSPDPKYGQIAKQRSTHNNYLTLPVIFVMIGGHYPMVFATEYSWIILALVLIIGCVIRHFFNTKHKGLPAPYWTWVFAAILTGLAIFLSYAGAPRASYDEASYGRGAELHANAVELVIERCSVCHAQTPQWDGLAFAPKGIMLENEKQVMAYVDEIFWQSAQSHAMPPGNVIWVEDEERALLAEWRAAVRAGEIEDS